jgi:hypothetical protein
LKTRGRSGEGSVEEEEVVEEEEEEALDEDQLEEYWQVCM